MKKVMMILLTASAVFVSACGHRYHKHECACNKAEGKMECSSKDECSMDKNKKKCCSDEKKEKEKTTP